MLPLNLECAVNLERQTGDGPDDGGKCQKDKGDLDLIVGLGPTECGFRPRGNLVPAVREEPQQKKGNSLECTINLRNEREIHLIHPVGLRLCEFGLKLGKERLVRVNVTALLLALASIAHGGGRRTSLAGIGIDAADRLGQLRRELRHLVRTPLPEVEIKFEEEHGHCKDNGGWEHILA